MNKAKLYSELYDAYVKANPSKTKQKCQEEVNEKGNSIKSDTSLSIKAQDLINDLKSIALKNKGTMIHYWASKTNASTAKKKDNIGAEELLFPLEFSPSSSQFEETNSDVSNIEPNKIQAQSTSKSANATVSSVYKTKAQDEIKAKVAELNSDLVWLFKRKAIVI